MHDRNNKNENDSTGSQDRKYDHQSWVNKYLDLADTLLKQGNDDRRDQAA